MNELFEVLTKYMLNNLSGSVMRTTLHISLLARIILLLEHLCKKQTIIRNNNIFS